MLGGYTSRHHIPAIDIMRYSGHMYPTTVVAAAIARSVGVVGSQQPGVPMAFAWGSNTFTASRHSLIFPGTSCAGTKQQQQSSPVNTLQNERNIRHSSSSRSSSSLTRMTSHGNGKYDIRECEGGKDYEQVIGSLDHWWGGRRMTPMLPRLFFEHFADTSFVAEMAQEEQEDPQVVGFVCGFASPSLPYEVSAPPHRIHVPQFDRS